MASESDPRDGKITGNEAADAPPYIHQPGAGLPHGNFSVAPRHGNQPAAPVARANPSAAPQRGKPPATRRFARTRWIGLITLLLLAGVLFQSERWRHGARSLEGYISDAGILEKEYTRYYGKALADPDLEKQFKDATALMLVREYPKAAALLEKAAAQASLPVVFNDLGVLYAEMNDRGRAVYAFREALARDGSYAPVRDNFERYKSLISDLADPLTREIEPNDTTSLANPIALDKPVEAEITAATRDSDTFRFNAPPPPRDILAVEFSNRSAPLIPVVRLYDSDDRTIDLGKIEMAAGSSFTQYFSPAPNVTLFLKLSGSRATGGSYLLTVKPLKAYDAFEPDDDIFSAHAIGISQSIEANIMDAQDTDYYSFVAPRTGSVTIEIRNRSTTLIPALTTFHPDRRNSGFGADVRNPGADLRHRLQVEEGRTYYLQVWSQSSSSGDYTLVVN